MIPSRYLFKNAFTSPDLVSKVPKDTFSDLVYFQAPF